MKKTISINLGGVPFLIDEDAYQLLEKYLYDLKAHFRKEDGMSEIMQDIETRIAELLGEKISVNRKIVTQSDVEEVIAQIGSPEEFSDTPEGEATASGSENKGTDTVNGASEVHQEKRESRRLFRNPDNKFISGVLGGFAVFFRIDPTMLRLIVLLLIPFVKILPVLYLILWAIIPEARTAAEKLAMQGKEATVENIGKTVLEDFENDGTRPKSSSNRNNNVFYCIIDGIVRIVAVFLKACIILLALFCSPILFVMSIVFFAILFAGPSILLHFFQFDLSGIPSALGMFGSLGGILFAGIPMGVLLFLVLQSVFHWKPAPGYIKWTLLILWIVGLSLMLVCYIRLGLQIPWWETAYPLISI